MCLALEPVLVLIHLARPADISGTPTYPPGLCNAACGLACTSARKQACSADAIPAHVSLCLNRGGVRTAALSHHTALG